MRGITVLAGDLRATQQTAERAEEAGFDAARSGEFLNRSAVVSVAAMAAVTKRNGDCPHRGTVAAGARERFEVR